MKKAIVILSALMLVAISCKQTLKKQVEATSNKILSEQEDNHSTVQKKYNNNPIEDRGKNFRQIGLNEKIGSRTLKDYLADEKIPQIFKDVFLQKQPLNDDVKTLALIDSLLSTDKERHPFYFVLVTHAMWWSDGAFSEPLGMAAKEYVESNTQQFLEYFSAESVLTKFDFEQWASYTLGEILIESEDDTKEQIEKTKNLMKKNCIGCSSEKIEMIDKFIGYMNVEYDKLE